MDNSYKELFKADQSSRFFNEGYSGLHYRLPKYGHLFNEKFKSFSNLTVLELGSGIGEMHETIKRYSENIKTYTLSEYQKEAVDNLLSKNYNALHLDACNIELPDNSVDIVCAFDVMHHVPFPDQMAKEMLRVSKRWVYLCEANGLSVIRKIGELSESAKSFGEKSYLPSKYSSFFGGEVKVHVKPFYFFVPPKLSPKQLPFFKLISEIGEKIPVLKWQSQSLEIYIDKQKIN